MWYPRVGLGTYVEGNASFVADACVDPITAEVTVVLPELGVNLVHTFSPSGGTVNSGSPGNPVVVEMSRDESQMEIVVGVVDGTIL